MEANALSSTEQNQHRQQSCADRSKQPNLLSCWPAFVPPPAKELMALYRVPHLHGSSCMPARALQLHKGAHSA